MEQPFFARPILNSPYGCPERHWELDASGQPTQRIIEFRRNADFITPIPRPKKHKAKQQSLNLNPLSTDKQEYDMPTVINDLRRKVDQWRKLPNPSDWKVSPETAIAQALAPSPLLRRTPVLLSGRSGRNRYLAD